MRANKVEPTIIDAVALPKLVRLEDNLCGASFFLMKLLPARFILDRALQDGLVRPNSLVIETTSGTFGLALAMLCKLRGYRLILVSDPAIEPPLQRRLEDLGTRVEIVREPAVVGGYQGARLTRMAELLAEHPEAFCPSQYDNENNPGSYSQFAELLTERIGRVDCLVGSVGSGGSMCGTIGYLRLLFPDTKAIGVDTHGSVIFGQPDRKRLLRGLGNSLVPENVNHTAFDEVHWVSAAEGFAATRSLHRRHALYAGPTSGAAYLIARWWAAKHPDASVVCMLPDEGYRYANTVYDDEWLRANNVLLESLPAEPELVTHPLEAREVWSRIKWSRRTRQEVVGTSPAERAP